MTNLRLFKASKMFEGDLDLLLRQLPVFGVSEEMILMSAKAAWKFGCYSALTTLDFAACKLIDGVEQISLGDLEKLLSVMRKYVDEA